MAPPQSLTEVVIEPVTFPPTVKPPASDKIYFLGGAGERGLEIEGKFIKFTAIGVYLEDIAVKELSFKWKSKSASELADSDEFFRDIVAGPFEKFARVTMILPLTGQQYSEKVSENCVSYWKATGIYSDAEAKAIEKFLAVFKEETFPPGSSVLFKLSPNGSLGISFLKDGSVPEAENAVIENKPLSLAILDSMIGKHGVSPPAKKSLAARLSAFMNEEDKSHYTYMAPPQSLTEVVIESLSFPPTVKPPASDKIFFLGGAGERGLEIEGKFIKFTAIGVYLEDIAVKELSLKWKSKSASELADSYEFFRDIVTGPFEKFAQVTMILPLTGQQYSEKVSENCVAYWKAAGIYSDAEAKAVEKFLAIFKEETFPPGSSILFKLSPNGSLGISFSEDGSVPEAENAVIENKPLSLAILESMIGKHGVSPPARKSLATRLSEFMN